jgi:hypothetical protein
MQHRPLHSSCSMMLRVRESGGLSQVLGDLDLDDGSFQSIPVRVFSICDDEAAPFIIFVLYFTT